jgi:hypothetical protein
MVQRALITCIDVLMPKNLKKLNLRVIPEDDPTSDQLNQFMVILFILPCSLPILFLNGGFFKVVSTNFIFKNLILQSSQFDECSNSRKKWLALNFMWSFRLLRQ